jgi:hypothetical protein
VILTSGWTSRYTAGETTTSPPRAWAWMRWGRFTAEPIIPDQKAVTGAGKMAAITLVGLLAGRAGVWGLLSLVR